jgi:hypothetical protein
MIKKLMTVDTKKNQPKKPKNRVRHQRAATRDLTAIKAQMQLSDRGMETKPGDLSPNQEGAKKNNMRSSEDLASDPTKENIRKARIRYFHSTNTYRGFTDGKDGPNTMREDMDFMQPKGGFSAELSHSGKNSNPISLNQSRMNESGMLCCICFDNPPDAVFMDCGHGGVCYDCSLDIWKTTEECYLCRAVSFFFLKRQENCASSAV